VTTVFEQIRRVASDVFGVPPEQISADSSPENVDAWDSIQHLTFILALEEKFHIQLSPEEIEKARTVGETARMVEAKTQAQAR
jgi:acyl carrier protein